MYSKIKNTNTNEAICTSVIIVKRPPDCCQRFFIGC